MTFPVASPEFMGEPDELGFFGEFGGRYVGEPLMGACQEVEAALLAVFIPTQSFPRAAHQLEQAGHRQNR